MRRWMTPVAVALVVCAAMTFPSLGLRPPSASVKLPASVHDVGLTTSSLKDSAPKCSDVFFLGARGSGEPLTHKLHGLGPEVYEMATIVRSSLNSDHITFRTLNVGYPADPVTDLQPTAAELRQFRESPLTAAVTYYQDNVTKYLTSIGDGITSTVSEAQYIHSQCPDAQLILAGYSQGAMVMHQAELQLASSQDTGLLSHIAGTLLVGDGDRVSRTAAREFGTSRARSEGIRTWLRQNSDKDVTDPAATANVCNAGDIVCDFGSSTVFHAAKGISVHESYTDSPALASAARWIAGLTATAATAGSWTAARAPLPAGTAAAFPEVTLFSVSCPSASWCAAVGNYNTSGMVGGLLLTRTGGLWTATTAPLPTNAAPAQSTNIESVACSSPSWCVAVGIYADSSGDYQGLLLTWSGTKWTAAEAPLPPADPGGQPNSAFLESVACASASTCVVAGTYSEYYADEGETLGAGGLLLTWSGTSWTATRAPVPPDGQVASAAIPQSPSDAACATASCLVAGDYRDTSGEPQGLLLTWSAGSWTAARAPVPAGTDLSNGRVQLYAAACPSSSSCIAAGYYQDGAGHNTGLVVTGAGGNWKVADTVPGSGFQAAACPTVSSCTVSGSTLLTGAGTSWRTVDTSEAGGVIFPSVSCSSASACAVATASPSESSNEVVLAGAGSTWAPATVQLPQGIGWADLNSISCPTAATCVAVGEGETGQGVLATGPG